MRRGLACLALLWWFLRFDPVSHRYEYDGGLEQQMMCEEQAAMHGFFTVLITSRDVFRDGKKIGRWQRACFEGPASLRPSTPVTVNVR